MNDFWTKICFLILSTAIYHGVAGCAKKSIEHHNQKGSDAVILSAVSDFNERNARFSSRGQGGCYVKEKKVHCWGRNDQNQLSLADGAHSYAPVVVSLDSEARAVAASESEACAITSNGIWCWGRGKPEPFKVELPSPLVSLAGGGDHFCGLDIERRVWCWGNNDFGQSGGETPDRVESPVEITGIDGKVTSVHPGFHHSCALSEAREAFCWGRNRSGQLGNGDKKDTYKPVYVTVLQGIVSIGPGVAHTCALTDSSKVFC